MHKFHFKNFDFLVVQPSPDHVINGGSVYVEGNTIKAVGDSVEVEKQIEDKDDVIVIEGKGKLIMPGLVDAHAHIGDWCSQICYNSLNFDMVNEVDQILDIYFWPAWAWYTAELENPWTPFELATLGGARALRLEDKIGTLDIGKRADLITYDISRESSFFPHMEATIIMGLIMQGPSGTTQEVMVDGKLLRQNGEFIELDEDDLWERTSRWINEFKTYYYNGLKERKKMVVRNHPDYAGI